LLFEDVEMKEQVLTRANAAFRQEQKAEEVRAAWKEYETNQAAVDANMMRLRALRLARTAAPTPKVKKRARRA
jgi:hypothetical protein